MLINPNVARCLLSVCKIVLFTVFSVSWDGWVKTVLLFTGSGAYVVIDNRTKTSSDAHDTSSDGNVFQAIKPIEINK